MSTVCDLFFVLCHLRHLFEETQAAENLSGGKYFPDSLILGSCQITNWISSHWRRLHFRDSRSYHRVQGPLSLYHCQVIDSTAQLRWLIIKQNKTGLYFSFFSIPHLYNSCWLGRICSSLLVFFSLKVRTAGEGLVVNTLMMPIGNDSVMSPVIFTMHL